MRRKVVLGLLASICWGGGAATAGEALYMGFRNPPRAYSVMPYWYWNGRVTPEETRRQIREMIGQGVYQAIVFPWDGMEVPYLSEAYWRQIGAALDIAKELGFTLNMADEYDWPSGHAWDFWSGKPELSRVLQQHPEFRIERLKYEEHAVNGPRSWAQEIGRAALVVAARQNESGRLEEKSLRLLQPDGTTLRWEVPAGEWLVTVYRLEPAVGGHNTRVDLLNPQAVRAYLDIVYEEYARRFPQHLGSTLQLTVADHEGAYGVPIAYTPRLWEEFEKRKQYDLRPMLPLLVHDVADATLSGKVRRDYLDVVSDLYVNSFTGQVAEWCRRHGLKHGTSAYEEQLYIQVGQAGDMFRLWRSGTLVEIDALLERARMPMDFKEAVSVAHFDRKPLLVENQGLQGHDSFLSPEKMRLGTNMCLLWGANTLVPYFDYDPRKITWPPQWFLGQPFWRFFHHYADYVRRAQYMNAQGRHVAPIAIYYPLETAFANSATLFSNKPHRDLLWSNAMDHVQNFYTALELELARGGWDYHIVDSYYLEQARIQDRALHLADEQFRVLILPPMTDMEERAIEKVRKFVEAGGMVLAVGELPRGLSGAGLRRFVVREHKPFMDRLDYMRPIEAPAEVRADLRPVLEALRSVEPPQVEVVAGDPADLYFSHRQGEGVDWYWVVNDTPWQRDLTLRFPGGGAFEKWNAETGERSSLPAEGAGQVTLRFGPWDAFFVVTGATGHGPVLLKPRSESVAMTLPRTGWRLTLEAPEIRVPYAQRADDPEPVWLAPERLSNRQWWLIGPFPYDDHQGFFRAYPPEGEFKPAAKYQGALGEVGWKWSESPTYSVTLRDRTPGVYYAHAFVYSPVARRANLLTAFADSMKVWWNGELKLDIHRHPKWSLMRDAWAERRPIEVRRGWNRVLLKIGPSLMAPTAFMFRIVDEAGATLQDLAYAREETLPPVEMKRERLTVAIPPGAGAGTFTIDSAEEPEHPVAFRTKTVPFTLQSWTDCGLAHYSGSAIYETEFDFQGTGKQVFLDLGEVGVAAEVWLNGEKVGERAWRPFRFDISRQVRRENKLRIRVANSDAGWQSQGDTIYPRGSWGLRYKTERDRLQAIRPNGLEGPVRILRVSGAVARRERGGGRRDRRCSVLSRGGSSGSQARRCWDWART